MCFFFLKLYTHSLLSSHIPPIPLAEFLSSQRRTEEAFQYRVKAAELAPEDYALVMAAASSLRLLDRKLEAERWYRQVSSPLTIAPDPAQSQRSALMNND